MFSRKFFNRDPDPELIVKEEDDDGNVREGVWREPHEDPERLPRFVEALARVKRSAAVRDRETDRSDAHLREGQGADAWNLARRPLDLSVKEVIGADGEEKGAFLRVDAWRCRRYFIQGNRWRRRR